MYITAAQYATITGRDTAEATTARLKRASLLLDARIGYYERNDDGYKLDMDGLTNHQQEAVKEWVAWMVVYLFDNNDLSPSSASVSLGRFSVTEHGQKGNIIPEQMYLTDGILEDSGIVNRNATLKHRTVEYDESEV